MVNKSWNIIRLPQVDSTNAFAWKLLRNNNPPEFTVIKADYQTKGRGQGENTWHSEKMKNLLMSIILYPHFLPVGDYFYLNKITSLAVVKCLDQYIPPSDIRIKWPNDIYYKNRKIAGILIQNELGTYHFLKSVVGIGLNVNQTRFPENIPNPVSLFRITGKIADIEIVLFELLDRFYDLYLQLRENHYQRIDEEYINHLYGLGSKRFFYDKTGLFEGIIKNVAPDGKLIVLKNRNETCHYDFKEVEFVIPPEI